MSSTIAERVTFLFVVVIKMSGYLFVDQQESLDCSSDSDSDNDANEKGLIELAEKLENDLANNKYLYNVHVQLVEIYKKLGDLTSVRQAFQRFQEYFPLTPELWMAFINVEKDLATSDEQKELVFQLFDKAVEDYLSVDLWCNYAQFAIGASNLDRTRTILDRGLNAVGLVCNGGALLWATYREIENLHISLYTEQSDEWKAQALRVANLFKRELSVPLLDMDKTYEEWKEWIQLLPDGLVDTKPVEYGYNKAKQTLAIYRPFEEQLLTAQSNDELLSIYKSYVKAVSDPSTVICIYERAASHLCLVPEFWLEYCLYAFKLDEMALTICKKALRNCPWSEELWVMKIRVLERLGKKEHTVMECFEEAIESISPNPGLELWFSYLEYNHRCVGSAEKLDKLFHQAMQQLGFAHDPQSKVSRFYSRILAHRGDIKKARKVWGQILAQPPNKELALFWLEFINIEKQYGEVSILRNTCQKALSAVKDWPQSIIDEWLCCERHFGTLDDVMKCINKCSEIQPVSSRNDQQSIPDLQQEVPSIPKGTKRKSGQQNGSFDSKRSRKDHGDIVRKSEQEAVMEKLRNPIEKNPKVTVFLSNLLPGVEESTLRKLFPNAVNLEIARDRKGKSRCFAYVQFKTEEEVLVALARDREPLDGRPVFISEIKTERNERKPMFKYATNEEKNKLFVKGLPVNKNKEEIAEIFKKHGAKDVRLVLHKSGQPKGLAYVEFNSETEAQQAMKATDQISIDEHVITVTISAPPQKKDKPRGAGAPPFTKNELDEPIRHARSRLQTSLLPRSVQVKSLQSDGKSDGQMKSNKDFREMLLKK
ncbi:hypothetical protein ABEB36_002175 [Hypothenemus hampei]|uniref:RRM domain-containing protein n=1 Tax=Hypothenemus hampei TaxID=57062 RepID=A0ABD1F4T6_HYPHA